MTVHFILFSLEVHDSTIKGTSHHSQGEGTHLSGSVLHCHAESFISS